MIPMGRLLTMAVGTVVVLEVVNIKVAPVLEGVDVTVGSTSVAFVKVATALEVVDVRVAVLEVVSIKVPILLV